MRRETHAIVSIAVERAVAPLREQQRQLEQTVTELRAELRALNEGKSQPQWPPREPKALSLEHPLATPTQTTLGDSVLRPNSDAEQPRPAPARPNDDSELSIPIDIGPYLTSPQSTTNAAPVPATTPGNLGYGAFLRDDDDDVPWQLNGARRRSAVAWTIGSLVFLALLAVAVSVVLSHVRAGY